MQNIWSENRLEWLGVLAVCLFVLWFLVCFSCFVMTYPWPFVVLSMCFGMLEFWYFCGDWIMATFRFFAALYRRAVRTLVGVYVVVRIVVVKGVVPTIYWIATRLRQSKPRPSSAPIKTTTVLRSSKPRPSSAPAQSLQTAGTRDRENDHTAAQSSQSERKSPARSSTVNRQRYTLSAATTREMRPSPSDIPRPSAQTTSTPLKRTSASVSRHVRRSHVKLDSSAPVFGTNGGTSSDCDELVVRPLVYEDQLSFDHVHWLNKSSPHRVEQVIRELERARWDLRKLGLRYFLSDERVDVWRLHGLGILHSALATVSSKPPVPEHARADPLLDDAPRGLGVAPGLRDSTGTTLSASDTSLIVLLDSSGLASISSTDTDWSVALELSPLPQQPAPCPIVDEVVKHASDASRSRLKEPLDRKWAIQKQEFTIHDFILVGGEYMRAWSRHCFSQINSFHPYARQTTRVHAEEGHQATNRRRKLAKEVVSYDSASDKKAVEPEVKENSDVPRESRPDEREASALSLPVTLSPSGETRRGLFKDEQVLAAADLAPEASAALNQSDAVVFAEKEAPKSVPADSHPLGEQDQALVALEDSESQTVMPGADELAVTSPLSAPTPTVEAFVPALAISESQGGEEELGKADHSPRPRVEEVSVAVPTTLAAVQLSLPSADNTHDNIPPYSGDAFEQWREPRSPCPTSPVEASETARRLPLHTEPELPLPPQLPFSSVADAEESTSPFRFIELTPNPPEHKVASSSHEGKQSLAIPTIPELAPEVPAASKPAVGESTNSPADRPAFVGNGQTAAVPESMSGQHNFSQTPTGPKGQEESAPLRTATQALPLASSGRTTVSAHDPNLAAHVTTQNAAAPLTAPSSLPVDDVTNSAPYDPAITESARTTSAPTAAVTESTSGPTDGSHPPKVPTTQAQTSVSQVTLPDVVITQEALPPTPSPNFVEQVQGQNPAVPLPSTQLEGTVLADVESHDPAGPDVNSTPVYYGEPIEVEHEDLPGLAEMLAIGTKEKQEADMLRMACEYDLCATFSLPKAALRLFFSAVEAGIWAEIGLPSPRELDEVLPLKDFEERLNRFDVLTIRESFRAVREIYPSASFENTWTIQSLTACIRGLSEILNNSRRVGVAGYDDEPEVDDDFYEVALDVRDGMEVDDYAADVRQAELIGGFFGTATNFDEARAQVERYSTQPDASSWATPSTSAPTSGTGWGSGSSEMPDMSSTTSDPTFSVPGSSWSAPTTSAPTYQTPDMSWETSPPATETLDVKGKGVARIEDPQQLPPPPLWAAHDPPAGMQVSHQGQPGPSFPNQFAPLSGPAHSAPPHPFAASSAHSFGSGSFASSSQAFQPSYPANSNGGRTAFSALTGRFAAPSVPVNVRPVYTSVPANSPASTSYGSAHAGSALSGPGHSAPPAPTSYYTAAPSSPASSYYQPQHPAPSTFTSYSHPYPSNQWAGPSYTAPTTSYQEPVPPPTATSAFSAPPASVTAGPGYSPVLPDSQPLPAVPAQPLKLRRDGPGFRPQAAGNRGYAYSSTAPGSTTPPRPAPRAALSAYGSLAYSAAAPGSTTPPRQAPRPAQPSYAPAAPGSTTPPRPAARPFLPPTSTTAYLPSTSSRPAVESSLRTEVVPCPPPGRKGKPKPKPKAPEAVNYVDGMPIDPALM